MGVLNTHHTPVNHPVDKNLLGRLEKTYAKIVLSTAWRLKHDLNEKITHIFNGLHGGKGGHPLVIGQTKDFGNGFTNRTDEIKDWVDHHPGVRHWIAIDDYDLAGTPKHKEIMYGHFVHTDPRVGLTEKNVEEAVAMLTGPAETKTE